MGTGGGEARVLRGPLDRESLRLGGVQLPDAAEDFKSNETFVTL
ncbi:hypothetical protein [Streptomyces sp. NPDC048496]